MAPLNSAEISTVTSTSIVETMTTKYPDLTQCRVGEVGGFLKYKCQRSADSTSLKCHNSDEFYSVSIDSLIGAVFEGTSCSHDPNFYQACDTRMNGFRLTNNEIFCANWLCMDKTGERIKSLTDLRAEGEICDDTSNCRDHLLDEAGCTNITTLRSGQKVNASQVCNNFCEGKYCEDEANCNGLTYGLYCNGTGNSTKYIPPLYICNFNFDCEDEKDEENCSIPHGKSRHDNEICRKHSNHTRSFLPYVPIHNFTRCAAIPRNSTQFITFHMSYKYCEDYELKKYQTNCSDPARVALKCHVDGYLSTVSIYMVCRDIDFRICDDDIDVQCLDVSQGCINIHKHALCDGVKDCQDGSDEKHSICRRLSQKTCQRRVGVRKELLLPVVWIGDGIRDCEDGSDEMGVLWPTCGNGRTKRIPVGNERCENVFLCPWDKAGFVTIKDLCDGLDTCGNENKVCSLSRNHEEIFTSVLSSKDGLVKNLSYCIKGLESIARLNKVECATENFIFPDVKYFGVDTKTLLYLPDTNQNCDNMFGENYVFTSCSGRCPSSPCPLITPPRYGACPGQMKNRVGTIANNEYLVFFTKSRDNIYTNKYFVCEDQIKCIDYSQVCDLVFNCEDGSDESACTNHFQCESSGRLIPLASKCDQRFDCLDMSDECNEQCTKSILEGPIVERNSFILDYSGWYLKVLSFSIGFLALVANLIIIIHHLRTLQRSATSVALVNKSLITLISFGDFLVGCYLLVIATYDTIIFKQGYCREQINWLTSSNCSLIGVLSTVGSQVSLFAMTGLSAVRFHGIRGPLRVPGGISKVKTLKIALAVSLIVFVSIAIAITPLIPILEDFFVNGVKFSAELVLFISTQNKKEIFAVLVAYYGRMKESTLSWELLLQMISGMFSHDEGIPDYTADIIRLDFYGNDGVCLFKYFVNKDDPQKKFVWGTLIVNLACFTFISISYISIGVISQNSSRNLSISQNKSQFYNRNRKMNRRIAIIISTDFLCWVPFITVCGLHFFEVLDATPWYSVFSMTILPINSVINPLIYDDIVTGNVRVYFNCLFTEITINFTKLRGFLKTVSDEELEMPQIEPRHNLMG